MNGTIDVLDPWAEDINGVWHERRDDFWDKDIHADVRAHALCGADIWSCHTSTFDPRIDIHEEAQMYCAACSAVSGGN